MLMLPRSRNGAPKPNTNFLRHIIRQTDNHNAALLAKEAEESRARLQRMRRDNAKEKKKINKQPGRLTPPHESDDYNEEKKRKRSNYSDDDEERHSSRRKHHREKSRNSGSRTERDRDSERDRRRGKSKHEKSQDNSPKRRSTGNEKHR